MKTLLLLLLALPAAAGELFSGTLDVHAGQLQLTLCGPQPERYALQEATPAAPVLPTLRAAAASPLYLQLFARHDERNGRRYLSVEAIKTLQAGQGCPD